MAVDRAELQQQALGIHRCLLAGDPTASADAATLLLDPLVNGLKARWPLLARTDACYDAAVEVVSMYLVAPARYDPSRSSLLGWLTMQAHGDLCNDHASPSKRFERSWLVESSLAADPDTGQPPTVGDTVTFDVLPDVGGSQLFQTVRDAFPDIRDRQLIWLICVEGSRSTEEAARVLGLEDLPPPHLTAEVRRHKDRVMQRLRRLGLDDHNE